jgi:hypothetical protein
VDYASSYVYVEHKFGFSVVEISRAKQSYDIMFLENGVFAQDYLTDRGAFKDNKFVKHIHDTHQLLRCCGTHAHHQNGVAERAIQTIINMASSMILHVSMHWKNGIDATLWPRAVTYYAALYNNTPTNGVCPAEVFTGSTVHKHRLMDVHVWGCPLSVMDPQNQQGQN